MFAFPLWMMYESPVAAVTVANARVLKATPVYSRTVLKAGRLKPSGQQSRAPHEGSEAGSIRVHTAWTSVRLQHLLGTSFLCVAFIRSLSLALVSTAPTSLTVMLLFSSVLMQEHLNVSFPT